MAHLFNQECLCCAKAIKSPQLSYFTSSRDYGICDKCYYELIVNPRILPPEPLTNRIIFEVAL